MWKSVRGAGRGRTIEPLLTTKVVPVMLIKNMHSILAELTRYSGASEQYLVTERAWSWFSLQSNALSASQPATH